MSESAATALSALHHFLDRPSVDMLRQVLGLTSSGTVRLVDSLVKAGYVRRKPGADARSTAITLTASGRAAAKRVADCSGRRADQVLAPLSEDERRLLDGVLGKILVGLMRERRRDEMELSAVRHRVCRAGRRLPGRQRSEASLLPPATTGSLTSTTDHPTGDETSTRSRRPALPATPSTLTPAPAARTLRACEQAESPQRCCWQQRHSPEPPGTPRRRPSTSRSTPRRASARSRPPATA